MDDKVTKARDELQQEYQQVWEDLAQIRAKFELVANAGPEDDIYGLLDALEDTVNKVKTGGLIGSGAKGHREAREKYFKAKGTPL
jgi:hypothetical protein